MSILVKLVGVLGTDTGNTLGPSTPSMTLPIPQDTKLDSFFIVDRESKGITRTIKEAMLISQQSPQNRNLGKYWLPYIQDGVLQDMQALCLQ